MPRSKSNTKTIGDYHREIRELTKTVDVQRKKSRGLTEALASNQRALQMAHAHATQLETQLKQARDEVQSLHDLTATLVKSMRSMAWWQRVLYVITGDIQLQPTRVEPVGEEPPR